MDFRGEIAGLPQFYRNKIRVLVGTASPKTLERRAIKPAFVADENGTPDKVVFHFVYNTGQLKAGATTVQVLAFPFGNPPAVLHNQPELLTAVPRPGQLASNLGGAVSAGAFGFLGAMTPADGTSDEKEDILGDSAGGA